jgi:glutamine amidotransferase
MAQTSAGSKPKIIIIDYHMGNVRSVFNALAYLGYYPIISARKEDIESADRLILPGVGAFSAGMYNLNELNLVELLNKEVLGKKKPILGICLGAQLFARKGYEGGEFEGLGWIDAEVVKMEPSNRKLKIPHIGWNDVALLHPSALFQDVKELDFYFVHSYYIKCSDPRPVTSQFEYGEYFTASIQRGTIFGVQFHPEKSQLNGLKLLQNFVEMTKDD